MIAVALLLQSAAVPVLGAIGSQQLPDKGCAAYLWSEADHQLVAMASAAAARLRIVLDGKPLDLPRQSEQGAGSFGLAASTTYRLNDLSATLDMAVASRSDLKDGAAVPEATLRIEGPGRDGLVVPLGGLIGCRP